MRCRRPAGAGSGCGVAVRRVRGVWWCGGRWLRRRMSGLHDLRRVRVVFRVRVCKRHKSRFTSGHVTSYAPVPLPPVPRLRAGGSRGGTPVPRESQRGGARSLLRMGRAAGPRVSKVRPAVLRTAALGPSGPGNGDGLVRRQHRVLQTNIPPRAVGRDPVHRQGHRHFASAFAWRHDVRSDAAEVQSTPTTRQRAHSWRCARSAEYVLRTRPSTIRARASTGPVRASSALTGSRLSCPMSAAPSKRFGQVPSHLARHRNVCITYGNDRRPSATVDRC